MKVPAGGRLIKVDGIFQVVYDIGGGAFVYYDFAGQTDVDWNGYSPSAAPSMSDEQAKAMFGGRSKIAHAGNASELETVKEPTYQAWIDKLLLAAAGGNQAWLGDAEVKAILADAITNNLGDAEVQARVRNTEFWRKQSEAGKNFNNASPAEQKQLIDNAAVELAKSYWVTNGQEIGVADPWLRQYAEQVARGQTTTGNVIETIFKPLAKNNTDSPWSREVRTEGETQRQRGVDIDNKSREVYELARSKWGVGVDQAWANTWAKAIIENRSSEEDLIESLKNQASVLYTWKDRDVETASAAQPWLEAYAQTFETGPPDLMNTEVQKALSSGKGIFDTVKDWRNTERWQYTKQARQELTEAAMSLGQRMGFE